MNIKRYTYNTIRLTLITIAGVAVLSTSPYACSQVTNQTPGSERVAPVAAAPDNQSTNAGTTAAASSPSGSPADILIGKGDLLQVSVYGMQDFNEQVRVDDAGDISLPMLGAVHVGGLASSAAESLIEKKLVDGGFFRNPHVSLFVKEYATQGVSVMGEVQKPGVYPLIGSHKLFDMISSAGGTTPKAGKSVLISHRKGLPQQVDLSDSQDPSKWASSNVEVLPGDTVMVSKAGIVYVVGDVRLPGGFVMERGTEMTVLQALALAQGANTTASLDKAKLIRKTQEGSVEQPIPLKKILASKSSDLKLRADDILFVPNSAAKSATRRGLEAALQAATGAAIYRF